MHPAHEEEGIGGQLLDWAEGYAISVGAERLEIVVETGQRPCGLPSTAAAASPQPAPDLLALVLPQAT